MARTRTLTNLIADVRKRADLEGATTGWPDAEITEYINQGIAKYHALMRQIRGDRAFATISTRACVAAQNYYSLASGWTTSATTNPDIGSQTTADLAAILSVNIDADGVKCNLTPFQLSERAALTDSNAGWSGVPRFYARRQSLIEVLPAPSSASYTLEMIWVPSAVRLSSGSDTFDGVDGWETMVIDWAALRAAEKDHNLALIPQLEKGFASTVEEITRLAHDIDDSLPAQAVDVRGFPARVGSAAWRRPWGRQWR